MYSLSQINANIISTLGLFQLYFGMLGYKIMDYKLIYILNDNESKIFPFVDQNYWLKRLNLASFELNITDSVKGTTVSEAKNKIELL